MRYRRSRSTSRHRRWRKPEHCIPGSVRYAIVSPRFGANSPETKRQAQLQAAIARHHQEQAQYTQRLADKRLSYKTKAQELADVRTICEQEARIKDLESQRARLQSGQPCPLCGSTTHPAIAAYQALELSANQTRRDALEKRSKRWRKKARRCEDS